MNIKKILLPIDGSPHSDTAADMAIKMAQDNDATIVLLNVRMSVPTGMIDPYVDDVREMLAKTAEETMKHYRSKLDAAKIDHKEMVIGGRVGEIIVNVAKDEDCDLIVMGSRGKSDLEGLVLGSETHKVLHTTHLPVLVVK